MSVEPAVPAEGISRQRANPILAATLGLFCSGIGALYAGRPRRAMFWLAAKGLVTIAGVGVLALTARPVARAGGLLFLLGGAVALPVVCAMDSWRVARRSPAGSRRAFQRLPVIAVAVLLYQVANFALNELIAKHAPARVSRVYGAAMVPTILNDERVVVRTLDPSRSLARGTLVTYTAPDGSGQRFLGRLVALPNDTVEVVERRVLVNGAPEGPYWNDRPLGVSEAGEAELKALSEVTDVLAPRRLGDRCVFILGDNRMNSRDSRHFGCVPRENLIATVDWWVWRLDPDGSAAWSSIGHDVQPPQP